MKLLEVKFEKRMNAKDALDHEYLSGGSPKLKKKPGDLASPSMKKYHKIYLVTVDETTLKRKEF